MALSKPSRQNTQGIQIRNFDDLETIYYCELCNSLQDFPNQFHCCGTRLCQFCSRIALPDSVPFTCPLCDTSQPRKQMSEDRGLLRELKKKRIVCYSCSWDGSYKDYLDHLQENHADLECSDCRKRFYTMHRYEEHRQLDCDFRLIVCPVPGCAESIKAVDMNKHCLTGTHQIMIAKFIVEFILSKKDVLRPTFNRKNNKREETMFFLEKLNSITPGLQVSANDDTRLRTEYNQLNMQSEKLMSDIDEVRKSFISQKEEIERYVQSQNELLTDIEKTKRVFASSRILLLDSDGIIIFPVRKSNEEINSLFSIDLPKFKTSSYGYVFKLRVCSTIDASNKNEGFLSVYISLLKSEHTSILAYPFPYNIAISLCDQSRQNNDVTTIIQASHHSTSLSRPTTEGNDEIGVLKFYPLNYLAKKENQYLKDNVFFIRLVFQFLTDCTPSIK